MSLYVFICQSNKDDKDFVEGFAKNKNILIGAIVTALVTLALIILMMKNWQRRVPINYFLGLTFATAVTFIAGYLTVKCDKNIVLTSFLITFCMAALMAFFGSHILLWLSHSDRSSLGQALGASFGILGSVIVIIILVTLCNPWGGD